VKHLVGLFHNERPRRCPDCKHLDHHTIEWGERPCFFMDPTQPDGFCKCGRDRAPRNAQEYVEAVLPPEVKPLRSVCGICEFSIVRESTLRGWEHALPKQITVELTQAEIIERGRLMERWLKSTTSHNAMPGWEGGDDRD
jgi:hypothetical protein